MSETNPTPPVPPSGPIVPGTSGAPVYTGPEPDKDSKTMAMLAHLLGILGPLGPLIIWLIKKEQQPFVMDQGKEALNFELTVLIGWAALFVISLVGAFTVILGCIGSLLMLGLFITNAVLCVMGGMKANSGVAYRYPINFRFIK